MTQHRNDRGQFRWKLGWFTPESIKGWIDGRRLVVARQGDKLAGVMLLQDTDHRFWPDRPDGEASFVHRLCRDPAITIEGGLARPMLDWALEETGRMGRPWLRLDCAPLEKLCAVYANAGFTRVDLKEIEPDFWSVRWEKHI